MASFVYLYDCKHARQRNARRVSFTKELYGFLYSWKTKAGIKQKRKLGLLDECIGAEAVADSAILVPGEYQGEFDSLFNSYQDILTIRIFEILEEVI
jgi:hypothetical protein